MREEVGDHYCELDLHLVVDFINHYRLEYASIIYLLSTMSKGRLNTVHDFSSLRLHPSGRRVQDQPGGEHKASTKNHHIKSHNTVRDAGGTWIVSDAAGPSTVLKRTDGDGEVQVGLSEEAKGKQRKVPPTSDGQHEDVGNEDEPTPQPRKRRKYTHRNDILPSAFTPDPNFNLPSSV